MMNMKLKPAVYSQFMKDQDPYRVPLPLFLFF
jgi:hypothetical protein